MIRTKTYQELKKGNKVTHKSFTKNEYLFFENNIIKTEDRYKFENCFWEDDIFCDEFEIYK